MPKLAVYPHSAGFFSSLEVVIDGWSKLGAVPGDERRSFPASFPFSIVGSLPFSRFTLKASPPAASFLLEEMEAFDRAHRAPSGHIKKTCV